MKGYKLFLKKIEKLDFVKQKKLIKKIFNINVLVFGIDEIDGNVCIKFYDGEIYYHFIFVFNGNSCDYLDIRIKERIIVCYVFVNNIPLNETLLNKDNFYKFVKILRDDDISCLNSFLEVDF